MKKHYWALVASVIVVAFAATFIKKAEASSIVIAAYRLGIAAVIITPIALIKARTELKKLTVKEYLLAISSGGFLALHFALWIYNTPD